MFVLTPCSMTDVEYSQWGLGIPFTDRVMDKSNYEEFSRTRLMPSLLAQVCFLASLISFNQSSFAFLYLSKTQMKHLYQEGPIVRVIIDPPRLTWLVYAYGPDGFARERPVGRNTNVTCYPFPKCTQAMSSLSSLFSFLSILAFEYLF